MSACKISAGSRGGEAGAEARPEHGVPGCKSESLDLILKIIQCKQKIT